MDHFQFQNHLCSPPAVAGILVLELYLYRKKEVSDYQNKILGFSLSLLEAMARQVSRAEVEAWAAQLLHVIWLRTGVTNPDNGIRNLLKKT